MRKVKAILFDLDGVVIDKKEKLFSQRLSEEKNIPMEDINEFFLKDFRECSFGRADLKEKIGPHLKKWKWQGSVEDFLFYWFKSESNLNKDRLEEVEKLRSKGIKCYIATRQEKHRINYLIGEVKLKNYFDGVFCTCDIGYEKSQPEFFEYIIKKLNLNPREIIFFDDKEENIKNAKKFGIKAYLDKDLKILKNLI